MEERDIKSYFEGVIENIDIILKNDFYKIDDKKKLIPVREDINKWYKDYIKNNTLKNIKPETLENIGYEISDFFDEYVVSESIKENYAERLIYDFGELELYWKDEMLGGKKNG